MMDNMDVTKQKRRKRLNWGVDGDAAIFELWAQRADKLRGVRKNGRIYAEMADELTKLGYNCSARDVQVKLGNYTQRYRKEKLAMGFSGGSPSTWPFYEKVHQIIGGFKANKFAELTLESISDMDSSSQSSLPSLFTSPPSLPSSVASPLAGTSDSASKKKGKHINNFQAAVNQFVEVSSEISQYLK